MRRPFPKKLFTVAASLYDSTVVGYRISGDMAFRLSFGDQPNFALALGGLNPSYQPPPGFPELRRLGVDLGINGNPSLARDPSGNARGAWRRFRDHWRHRARRSIAFPGRGAWLSRR
ncbi:MAG TPA: DUF6603 domain-containing protein [Polyangiaceae bacterium]